MFLTCVYITKTYISVISFYALFDGARYEGWNPPTLVETNIFVVVKKATQAKASITPSPIVLGEARLTVYPKDKPKPVTPAPIFVGGAFKGVPPAGRTNALSVDVGENATVSVTFNPANTHRKNVTWTSSNPSFAEVFGGGTGSTVISGLTAGNTIIICQSVSNPEVKLDFYIVVRSIINKVVFTTSDGAAAILPRPFHPRRHPHESIVRRRPPPALFPLTRMTASARPHHLPQPVHASLRGGPCPTPAPLGPRTSWREGMSVFSGHGATDRGPCELSKPNRQIKKGSATWQVPDVFRYRAGRI